MSLDNLKKMLKKNQLFNSYVSLFLYFCNVKYIIPIAMNTSKQLVIIILLCIPLGMASGAIYPSVLTILMNFSGKRTAMATGLITAATGLGANVFTAMTGFLVDIFGFRNALVILASFFMISIISVLQVEQLLIRLGKRKD